MKKLIYFLGFGLMATTISCTKQIDEAYWNPNAQVKQPIETLLPNVISNMAVSYTANGTNYGLQNDGIYVGRYVQMWSQSTANYQYDQMGGVTGASDILGSVWAMHYYGQGQNLNKIIEWGTEEKKWDYVGVAYAIRAWSWLTLTDMYGPAILKEAFNTSQLVFHYDKQEEIYQEVKRNYKLAMDNLNKTGDGVSQANLALGDAYFYNGDVEKWKKFANSVMARVYNRTTNKADYKPDSVVYYANMGITDNADNASVKFQGISTATDSYYGPFRGNMGSVRQTKFVADLMTGFNPAFLGLNDPRAIYLLRKNPNGTFKGVTIAQGTTGLVLNDRPENMWGGAFATTTGSNNSARYLWKDASPWPIITAADNAFLIAEAKYRKGDKTGALAAYRDGVSKNIDMLTTTYNTSVPTAEQITPAIKASFMADPLLAQSESTLNLSHIMLQKYIAMNTFGAIETWVDMRRYHYTDTEAATGEQVYRDFTLPISFYIDNNGKPVYRARPRYNSEFLYNIDALDEVGGRNLDYHTYEMWFSQP